MVENVTILELTFETEVKPYNLGVVDNYQTPDLNPDGEYTTGDGIEQAIDDFIEKMDKWWEQLLFILGIVVAGIAIVFVVSVIWPIKATFSCVIVLYVFATFSVTCATTKFKSFAILVHKTTA